MSKLLIFENKNFHLLIKVTIFDRQENKYFLKF